MNVKILIIILFTWQSTTTKAGDPIFCKGKDYRGYIFDSGHFTFMSFDHQRSRYTPSVSDVANAEHLLSNRISKLNSKRPNQLDGCPIIHENLEKYCRQYIGYINSKNQRVIWINLFWDKELEKRASKEVITVFDGCSYYWTVEINIDTRTVFNFAVNGLG